MDGSKIPLKEIANVQKITGPAFIYRDNTKRFIGVKFSVRDRDLGSTIAEAQKNVNTNTQTRSTKCQYKPTFSTIR
ncbi:MAG TPA: hypothetical protein PLN99_13690 [Daejeonella sp.]|nr:hypothetical protein [Daejeonella sp.]